MVHAIVYSVLKTSILFGLSVNAVLLAGFGYIKLKLEAVKAECKSKARLDKKVAIVTGGSQGIGLETARDLASRGAAVIIACRNENKAKEAVKDIIKETGNKNVEYRHLNLAQFSSIRKFAKEFNDSYQNLDILVNNAGCGFLKHKASEDGIDMVMQINYLGPFLLTNLLLDKIKTSDAGRIIIVSSLLHHIGRITPDQLKGMHTKNQFLKYCNSKLCDVLWMKALAERLPSNVTVNALHPGVIKTDLFRKLYPFLWKWFLFILYVMKFKTPREGAQTSIHLAVSEEVVGVSGKYFMECKEAKCSYIADNKDLVNQVWNESIVLTET